jgi:hypothetical protein
MKIRKWPAILALAIVVGLVQFSGKPFESDAIEALSPDKGKIKAVHLFRTRNLDSVHLNPIVNNHIEWLVLVPYAYQRHFANPELRILDMSDERWQRRNTNLVRNIEVARQHGLQTIIKPHIWMHNSGENGWRGDIGFETEAEWTEWLTRYENFILHYARMSEEYELPLFCIGTELRRVVQEKPDFWKELVGKVKEVYSGKITYAANWYMEYEEVTFWDQLDFIGIQGYFPLSQSHQPSVEELRRGWEPHASQLQKLSKAYNKRILFTELGYSSTSSAAAEPWAWIDRHNTVGRQLCTATQANCYEAFFREFWDKPWCAGVMIWEWYGPHDQAGGALNMDFTPQNKPAEKVLNRWFSQPIAPE